MQTDQAAARLVAAMNAGQAAFDSQAPDDDPLGETTEDRAAEAFTTAAKEGGTFAVWRGGKGYQQEHLADYLMSSGLSDKSAELLAGAVKALLRSAHPNARAEVQAAAGAALANFFEQVTLEYVEENFGAAGADVCPCFPGTCRGGEIINGATAWGQRCRCAGGAV